MSINLEVLAILQIIIFLGNIGGFGNTLISLLLTQ